MKNLAPLQRNFLHLVVVLFVGAINGLLFLFIVPPWQHYDEPNHFEYAWLIAHRGRIPQRGEYDQEMRRATAISMIEHNFFKGMSFLPDLNPGDQPIYIGTYTQLGDPPLYYLLSAIPLRLFPAVDITTQLYLARCVSLAMFLCTLLAGWGMVVELTPDGHALRWLVPLAMALWPSFVDNMTTVNSDAGAAVFFSGFLWVSVRLMRRGFSLLRAAGVVVFALCCLLTKTTVFAAGPLALLVFLLAPRAANWRRAAWAALVVGGTAFILLGVFDFSGTQAAFWYFQPGEPRAERAASPQAPLGDYLFRAEILPEPSGQTSIRQLIPLESLAALRGKTVTVGAWMWASRPTTVRAPILVVDGSGNTTSEWKVSTTPAFYSFHAAIADTPSGRGWMGLLTFPYEPTEALTVYYDGLVLCEGMRPLDQTPVFASPEAASGLWGGEPFVNAIRNASAEQAWPGVRAWLDIASTRILPDQGRFSVIYYSIADIPGSIQNLIIPAERLVRSWFGVFGWGHVRLIGDKPFRTPIVLGAIGLFGAAAALVWARRRIPWNEILWLSLALIAVWGMAWVRSSIYIFNPAGWWPGARYAFSVTAPTLLVFMAGWLFWLCWPVQWLRLRARIGGAVMLLALAWLNFQGLYSIYAYYYLAI